MLYEVITELLQGLHVHGGGVKNFTSLQGHIFLQYLHVAVFADELVGNGSGGGNGDGSFAASYNFV